MMNLFFILSNQLFPSKYLDRFKKDHIFFMAEDNGLCTYEKHHKQKILLFLSSIIALYKTVGVICGTSAISLGIVIPK